MLHERVKSDQLILMLFAFLGFGVAGSRSLGGLFIWRILIFYGDHVVHKWSRQTRSSRLFSSVCQVNIRGTAGLYTVCARVYYVHSYIYIYVCTLMDRFGVQRVRAATKSLTVVLALWANKHIFGLHTWCTCALYAGGYAGAIFGIKVVV